MYKHDHMFAITHTYWQQHVIRHMIHNMYSQQHVFTATCDDVRWSLFWLFKGKWPTRDDHGVKYTEGVDALRAGTDLAGGFFAVVFGLTGDLPYMSDNYDFPDCNSAEPCGLCQANATTNPWTDCCEEPCWFPTAWIVLGVEAWRAWFGEDHPILSLPGVCAMMFLGDWMHNKNIGSDNEFYGSVLEYFCFDVAGDPHDILAGIWSDIHTWYRDHGTQSKYSTMKTSMFHKKNGFPRLKGRAAEVKNFGKPLLYALRDKFDLSVDVHRWIKEGLQASIAMEDILEEHPFPLYYKLPQLAAEELCTAFSTFAQRVTALRRHFAATGVPRMLFKYTSKLHYTQHTCQMSQYIHPALGTCWSGEDFMHQMQRVIQSCLSASPPHLVVNKALQKYAYAFFHSLELQESGALRYRL
jgi:hypothetical protein